MTDAVLPAGFEVLEPFVTKWAVRGSDARMRARLSSTEADRVAFYECAREVLDSALAHLDARGLDHLDATEQRLLDLVLSLAQVAFAVEQQRDLEPRHARMQSNFTIERSSEDFDAPRAPTRVEPV